MTINEVPQDKHEAGTGIDPFLANVFTAMFKQSEDITNRVLDNKDAEIRAWQSRFFKLYDAVAVANLKIDSVQLERILDHWAWDAEQADRALDAN
jgi:hypothetical protein